jgi:hypothetical protein
MSEIGGRVKSEGYPLALTVKLWKVEEMLNT